MSQDEPSDHPDAEADPEADGDSEEDYDAEIDVIRTAFEAPEPPPPTESFYKLNPDGSLPGTLYIHLDIDRIFLD